jgi:hypothetical protein
MPHTFRHRLSLAITALAVAAVAHSTAGAQSMPGGFGGERGGHGGRRGGIGPATSPAAGDAAKRFEEMASLKSALAHVDGLSHAQKDSLKHVEATYKADFKQYGVAAKKLFAGAGAAPNPDEYKKLEEGAHTLRADELAAARAVLATDAQRATFDANVAAMREPRRSGA